MPWGIYSMSIQGQSTVIFHTSSKEPMTRLRHLQYTIPKHFLTENCCLHSLQQLMFYVVSSQLKLRRRFWKQISLFTVGFRLAFYSLYFGPTCFLLNSPHPFSSHFPAPFSFHLPPSPTIFFHFSQLSPLPAWDTYHAG